MLLANAVNSAEFAKKATQVLVDSALTEAYWDIVMQSDLFVSYESYSYNDLCEFMDAYAQKSSMGSDYYAVEASADASGIAECLTESFITNLLLQAPKVALKAVKEHAVGVNGDTSELDKEALLDAIEAILAKSVQISNIEAKKREANLSSFWQIKEADIYTAQISYNDLPAGFDYEVVITDTDAFDHRSKIGDWKSFKYKSKFEESMLSSIVNYAVPYFKRMNMKKEEA